MEPSCLISWILAALNVQDRFGPDARFPVFYFLGLAAAGLLAVLKNRSRPAIFVLLATLWTAMAVGYHVSSLRSGNPLVHNATELLALLQAVFFLAAIAEPSAARFEPRDGSPWRLAGSALLLYSLAVYPLLGGLTGGRMAGMYIAGLPFPPLVLTLGILFFLAKPFPPLLLIPLLGAATGGIAAARLDDAHHWALRLVFIAGCLFTFLPWETWGGREKRQGLYEELQRRRTAFEVRLMVLVLAVLALFFAWEHGAPLDPVLHQLSTSLGLLAVAGLVLWMAFPAWLNPGFRMVAWPVAKGAGRFWAWFKGAWKWIALLLVTVSLVDYVTLKTVQESMFDERSLVVFLAAAFLLWLIHLAYQGRKRLVIQPFEANTEDEDLKKYVKGVQAQLRNELARLSDLYRVIDEASPKLSDVVEVTVEVQDVGEILKESAGTAPVKLFGGVELPTDFLFSLVSRLVKGPRITGSLYGGGKEPVLVAELSGGGMRGNWRVDMTKLDRKEKDLPAETLLRTMTEQLAFRIATQIVSIGSPRWRAVRCFTEGLRRYRETQRTGKDRDVKLRLAERCLLDAAKEDDKFAQSHYNLGVVYQHLGELGSAKSAFRWALREDPGTYEASYALAETSVEDGEYDETIWFCEAAIGINPSDARAWDLKGYAWRKREEKRQDARIALPPDHPLWEQVLPWREIAVALAWRRLCQSALAGPGPILERAQGTAVLCTRNLAVVLSRMTRERYEESRLVFRQALRLAAYDPELRFVLGRILYLQTEWPEAAAALRGVFDDSMDTIGRSLRWATLARVYSQTGAPEEARTALKRLLDLTASFEGPQELDTWGKALDDCLEYPARGSFKAGGTLPDGLEPALRRHHVAQPVVQEIQEAYGNLAALGLGSDGTGEAWLRRLLGFQKILGILHPGPGQAQGTTASPSPFKSLQAVLARPEAANGGGDADLLRLQGLRDTLRELVWQEETETRDAYLERVGQRFREYLARTMEPHKGALRELGLDPDSDRNAVLAGLLKLRESVTAAQALMPTPEAGEVRASLEALLDECFRDAVLGWEWAYCQVQVKQARLHLDRGETSARQSTHAEAARAALADAIPRLEAHGFQQPQEQGLQALFARATLARAEALPRDAPDRVQLLRDALVHARRAAELNPESAQDRASLVKVYSALGDHQQAQAESELCMAMDNSPEILRLVGSCFWARAAAAGRRPAKRAVLKDAVSFFTRTLELIETQAFQEDQPFEQIHSHAWGHYWLGRFHCELLEHEQGTAHQEISRSMGFKPLESRVNLGQAYLEARDLDRAQVAFAEAEREAGRWRYPNLPRQVAEGPGEDRPVDELLFEVYLGQAFLHLERGLPVEAAKPLVRRTEALIGNLDPAQRSSRRAAVHEALAWIHLRAGRLASSQEEARRSLELAARGGAYLCLAKALAEKPDASESDRRAAREACQWGLRADARGLQRREIRLLLAQLADKRPAEAGAQPKPSGGGSPAVVA